MCIWHRARARVPGRTFRGILKGQDLNSEGMHVCVTLWPVQRPYHFHCRQRSIPAHRAGQCAVVPLFPPPPPPHLPLARMLAEGCICMECSEPVVDAASPENTGPPKSPQLHPYMYTWGRGVHTADEVFVSNTH